MNFGPKLPCEACGGRDIVILAAVPRMNPQSPHTHYLQVRHVSGRRCWVGVIPGPVGATMKRMLLNPSIY